MRITSYAMLATGEDTEAQVDEGRERTGTGEDTHDKGTETRARPGEDAGWIDRDWERG